jgi:hypothetical protein
VTDVMSPYAIKKARNLSEDSAEVVFGTWGMGMGSVALAAFRCRRHRMGGVVYAAKRQRWGTVCAHQKIKAGMGAGPGPSAGDGPWERLDRRCCGWWG